MWTYGKTSNTILKKLNFSLTNNIKTLALNELKNQEKSKGFDLVSYIFKYLKTYVYKKNCRGV